MEVKTDEAMPFKDGDVVEILPKRQHAYPAKYRGRSAEVIRCFRHDGQKEYVVSLYWLHKTTGKRLPGMDYFGAHSLAHKGAE